MLWNKPLHNLVSRSLLMAGVTLAGVASIGITASLAGPIETGARTRPATETPAAVIAALTGEVAIERPTSPSPLAGTIGARLLPGDVVKVGKGGSATVYLAGGGIVRVPSGSRIEIPKEAVAGRGAPRSAASGPAGAMSSRSVEVLEAGLWILNDPEGSVLLTAMRGDGEWEGDDEAGAVKLLTPRYETVLDEPPRFAWSGLEGDARLVIAQGSSIIWKSGPVRSPYEPRAGAAGGSAAGAAPAAETFPALRPGTVYRWWVEPSAGAPAAPPEAAPFRLAERREQGDAEKFESEVGALASGPDGPAVAGLMRCAYYVKLGSWTRVVEAAQALRSEPGAADAAARALEGSRHQMRLDEDGFAALTTAVGAR